MKYQTLQIELVPNVATIWLDRPDVGNALNDTAIDELTHAFIALGANYQVKVIVLAARGKAFCAANDLERMKKITGYTHAENCADAARLAALLSLIYRCPKPVVARVQGDCFSSAMGLVAACDIAVAATEAQFSLSDVKLGLTPATIAPYVVKSMGGNVARKYFITAECFSAEEAYRIGFIHVVASSDQLDNTVNGLVNSLLSNSAYAVCEAKRLVQDMTEQGLTSALIDDTVGRSAGSHTSIDGREGVRSFLENRMPVWALSA